MLLCVEIFGPVGGGKMMRAGQCTCCFFWDCVLFLIYTKKMGHSHGPCLHSMCFRCIWKVTWNFKHHFLLGGAHFILTPKLAGNHPI